MSAIFNDAVNIYGSGKVLGILAIKSDDHDIRKREATVSTIADIEEPTTTVSPTEEPIKKDYEYIHEGKMMLYTTSAPVLFDNGSNTTLEYHGLVTTDERKDEFVRLIVSFKVNIGEVTKV